MCVDDMDDFDREVSGMAVFAQDIVHALKNARGRFIDAPDAGTDTEGFLSQGMTPREIEAAAARMRAEVEDDERCGTATVAIDVVGETFTVRIGGTLVDGEPFGFVVEDFAGVALLLLGGADG
jgi:hypothetical protein